MKFYLTLLFLLIAFFLKGQNTILWVVKDTANNKTSYLLGAYQAMGNHFVDAHPMIKEKIIQSEIAIFDSVEGNKNSPLDYIMKRKSNFSYQRLLKKKYVKKLESLSKDWKNPLSKMTPNEVLLKLRQQYFSTHCKSVLKTDNWSHLGNYLRHIAEKANLSLLSLESDFSNFDIETVTGNEENSSWHKISEQVYFWIDSIKIKKDNAELCKFPYQYKKMNLDYYLKKDCAKDLELEMERINQEWLKTLIPKLETNNCFIVIGLYHLYNKCGLIEQLKNKGFEVSPVKMK